MSTNGPQWTGRSEVQPAPGSDVSVAAWEDVVGDGA